MTKQELLPGMQNVIEKEKKDKAQATFKELIERFPRPQTREEAEEFLRNLEKDKDTAYSVDWTVKPRKGYDYHRMVLKTADADENDIKKEIKFKIECEPAEDYDQALLDAANKIWDEWIACEEPKY